MPGFPNLFTITGPGSPSVLSNMPVSIEQHVEWIGDCLALAARARRRRYRGDRARRRPPGREHVQQIAATTLFPKAASWYMGANIPGKPRVFLPVHRRRRQLPVHAATRWPRCGYEGFDLVSDPSEGNGDA